MRRGFAAIFAAAFVVAATAGPSLAETAPSAPVETNARASILAAVLDAQPAFDPALVDSRATRSNIGTSSLNSVVWPSFLVDAFFFLYGFQSVERIGLGISEARWPQGPETERATLSDLAFANGGDPDLVPGKVGRSQSKADGPTVEGTASLADGALPGGVLIGKAVSRSDLRSTGLGHDAVAEQVVTNLVAGPLRVETIRGVSTAEVQPSGAGDARLAIVDATIAGVPVRIDEQGARAATVPLQEQIDDSLDGSGIQVRVLPAKRSIAAKEAATSSGGLLVEVRAVATDPSGTPRDVRVGYVFGASAAAVRVGESAVAGSVGPDSGSFTDDFFIPGHTTQPVLRSLRTDPVAPSGPLVRRRVIVTQPAGALGATARGLYGAIMLAGLGLLFLRPLLRATARP